jgi:small GTP-binding protein
MLRRALVATSSSVPNSLAFRQSAHPRSYSRLLVANTASLRSSSLVVGWRLYATTTTTPTPTTSATTAAATKRMTNHKLGKARRGCPTDFLVLSTRGTIRRDKSTKAENDSNKAPSESSKITHSTANTTTTTSTKGIYGLLSTDERQILLEQRELTTMARALASDILVRHQSNSSNNHNNNNSTYNSSIMVDPFPSTTLLQDLELDSTFAIVVTGEFNAGKSTLINALLGQKVLESGAIPTTDSITILTGTKDDEATTTKKNNQDKDKNTSNDHSTATMTTTTTTAATTTPKAQKTFLPPTIPQKSSSSSLLFTNPPHSNDPSSSSSPSPPSKPQPPLGVVLHSIPHQPLLRDLTIIDTPGTNAPLWMDHTDRTLKLLPAADLLLFVTSADRPMTESERQLMTQIQTAYRKPIVVVLNKMDILNATGGDQGDIAKQQVVDFVIQNVSDVLLGGGGGGGGGGGLSSSGSSQYYPPPQNHHQQHHHQVMVLPVSAKDALAAKLMAKKPSSSSSSTLSSDNNNNRNGNYVDIDMVDSYLSSNIWQRSNFQALEHFLKDSLTTKTRIQSKLTSPIGVVEGVMETCLKVLHEQNVAIQDDVATLNLLNQQWTSWKDQLEHELQLARQDMVDLILYESQRVTLLLSSERMTWFELYTLTLIPSNYPIRLLQQWEDTNHPSLVGRRQGQQQFGTSGKSSSTLQEELLSHVQETA